MKTMADQQYVIKEDLFYRELVKSVLSKRLQVNVRLLHCIVLFVLFRLHGVSLSLRAHNLTIPVTYHLFGLLQYSDCYAVNFNLVATYLFG